MCRIYTISGAKNSEMTITTIIPAMKIFKEGENALYPAGNQRLKNGPINNDPPFAGALSIYPARIANKITPSHKILKGLSFLKKLIIIENIRGRN